MVTVFWVIIYVLSWIVHLSWYLVGDWIALNIFNIKAVLARLITVLLTWITIVVLCSGCPFMYLHQYIEKKAGWRQEITYKFEDSTVYKHIINPVKNLTGGIDE